MPPDSIAAAQVQSVHALLFISGVVWFAGSVLALAYWRWRRHRG